jgi:hypothetical protein
VSLTTVAKYHWQLLTPVQWQITASVVNTGGKIPLAVIDTGGKLLLALLTPVAN